MYVKQNCHTGWKRLAIIVLSKYISNLNYCFYANLYKDESNIQNSFRVIEQKGFCFMTNITVYPYL